MCTSARGDPSLPCNSGFLPLTTGDFTSVIALALQEHAMVLPLPLRHEPSEELPPVTRPQDVIGSFYRGLQGAAPEDLQALRTSWQSVVGAIIKVPLLRVEWTMLCFPGGRGVVLFLLLQ
jgi:hypothetical protein